MISWAIPTIISAAILKPYPSPHPNSPTPQLEGKPDDAHADSRHAWKLAELAHWKAICMISMGRRPRVAARSGWTLLIATPATARESASTRTTMSVYSSMAVFPTLAQPLDLARECFGLA